MKVIPVLCGSAFKNKGVQQLLDGVVDFLPSPLDIPPVLGLIRIPNKEVASEVRPIVSRLRRLAFKIMTDPFAGQLTFFRVYSGTLKTGTSGLECDEGDEGSVGRLLKMHANKREDIDEVAMRVILSRPSDSKGRRLEIRWRMKSSRFCSK